MGAGVQQGGAGNGRRSRRRAARPMSEINVTPMVDVMLVLLIIFMVTAPLLTVGVEVERSAGLPKVELPKTEAGQVEPGKEPLNITVNLDGKIFLQDTEVTFDELVPKLTAIREAGTGDRVWVRGDNGTPYGNVAKVLARIKQVGLPVTLVTDQVDAL